MFRSRRKITYLAFGLALILAVGVALGASAQTPSGPPALDPQASGAAGGSGSTVTYSVTLVNTTSAPVGNIFVAVSIPDGLTDVKATQTPAGAWFQGVQGGNAVWLANVVPASGRLGPFAYQASVPKPPRAGVTAWVHWQSPSDGVSVSKEVTWAAALAAGAPRRGCTACHPPGGINPAGQYSLLWEAEEQAAARGGQHPTVAPDGSKLAFAAGAETCLLCHAPGTGNRAGMGVVAPLALRDIVHPAHQFSPIFKDEFGGNCFTCHNVAGDGSFQLLSQKVDVNDKGVPNPARLPIPGALPPSEGRR